MLEFLQPIAQAAQISVRPHHRPGIAIVGAGTIVDAGHLPAYHGAGLNVVGLHDIQTVRAQELAQRHGVATVYEELDALLHDPRIDVIDIAVTPGAQQDIALRALRAGKHVLCQKPLALTLADASHLVKAAQASNLILAVNQQMRFSEGVAAARAMVKQGWIGKPVHAEFAISIRTDWAAWPWLLVSPKLDLLYHSIHYLDTLRSWFGEPSQVFCLSARTPGQVAVGETRTISSLTFADGQTALVNVNHENRAGDYHAAYRIEGDRGVIRGTLGLLYDYPHGRPDTLEVKSDLLPTNSWIPYPVTTRWIPDAFLGPMASLLHAIATDGTPETSGKDNLQTLALVDALYTSANSGQTASLTLVERS